MKKIYIILGIICLSFSTRANVPCATAITENDTDRYIFYPLPSGDTAVYYITSDSTVAAGSPTTHYFLNHKHIRNKNVVIPETVEYKGREYLVTKLFGGFVQDTVKSVVLPKSVDEIVGSAFYLSTIENISPLHCRKIGENAFAYCQYLKNVDMSRCTFDSLPDCTFVNDPALQWVKLPRTVIATSSDAMSSNFFHNMKSMKFVIVPPLMQCYYIPVDGKHNNSSNFPTIFLSKNPPAGVFPPAHQGLIHRKVFFPCEYDSAYRNSNWMIGFDSVKFCHFLNLDSGYLDLDSVCPWEVERKYGFHPDTVGVYIVEKHNPGDCDSFNIYFVKSFLDPGEIYDTTINIEPNKEDTSVLWTWEGTGYAYNVYRDGDYITTVEQPYYLDTNIEMDVQYCYNFAPVNERYCEGKWSTTNCYTMLSDTTGVAEHAAAHSLVIYPNPAKNVLFISANEPTNVNGHINGTSYEITDVTGRMVLQGSYNATEGIHVGNLAKGVYLLRMEGKVGKFGKE